MKITEASVNKMNLLLKDFFAANAESDNIAYWLGYNYYNKIEAVYHQAWAHVFPSDKFADGLSNFMLKLNIRPVRLGIDSYDRDFANLIEVFEANKALAERLLNEIHELIEIAEMNDDVEVKLYGEELALAMLDYVKQANEWDHVAKAVDPINMNNHIGDYTNFIK